MTTGGITISIEKIRRLSMVYISMPLLCFFAGWLRWYWSIPALAACIVCIYLSSEKMAWSVFVKNHSARYADTQDSVDSGSSKSIVLSQGMFLLLIGIAFAFAFFCGIGRFWAQSLDYPWRNAIFRDLILRSWPVYYSKFDGAMCYYIGLWLPPAVFGKIAYSLGCSADSAFYIGNVAMLLYVTTGLTILFLLIIAHFQAVTKKTILLLIIGFIFFSGMDALGIEILPSIKEISWKEAHIEWWALIFQYSSFTTCMSWVFNQTIISWICMLLVLREKRLSNLVFIGLCCLFSGPFPLISIFIYSVAVAVKRAVCLSKQGEFGHWWGEVFSMSNVLSIVFMFPFLGTYLLSNAALAGTGTTTQSKILDLTDVEILKKYIVFVLIEFGIYAILIAGKNKKNYLYYVTVAQLLVFPFLRFGTNSDFSMRASIPALFVLYLLCYEFLLSSPKEEKKDAETAGPPISQRTLCIVLAGCLLIGAITPSVEFFRGARQVSRRGIFDKETDSLYTIGGDGPYELEDDSVQTNFVSLDLDEQIFFRYFAK